MVGLLEGAELAPKFLDYIRLDRRRARNLMRGSVVTVTEDAELPGIPELLARHAGASGRQPSGCRAGQSRKRPEPRCPRWIDPGKPDAAQVVVIAATLRKRRSASPRNNPPTAA